MTTILCVYRDGWSVQAKMLTPLNSLANVDPGGVALLYVGGATTLQANIPVLYFTCLTAEGAEN